MNKKQNILLVMDETERSMIVEALHNDIHYNFPSHFFVKEHEKYHLQQIELLEKIKATSGGFRLRISEDNIYEICNALRWNSNFILSEKERSTREEMDEYTKLSYILEGRNKNMYLFSDFDPKQYTLNTQLKPFRKFDFTQKRILLIRFEKGEMEFIKEFYREANESDEQYMKRADETIIKQNADLVDMIKYNEKFANMEYKAIFFTDLVNHKLKKGFSYHT